MIKRNINKIYQTYFKFDNEEYICKIDQTYFYFPVRFHICSEIWKTIDVNWKENIKKYIEKNYEEIQFLGQIFYIPCKITEEQMFYFKLKYSEENFNYFFNERRRII